MKVGLVVEWLDASRGGAETSAGQFIDGLLERGVSLAVVTRSDPAPRRGMELRTVPARSRRRATATAEFIRFAERWAPDAGCDLIHALTPCVGADVYQPRGGLVAETVRRTAATRRTAAGRTLKRLAMTLNARQRLVLSRERAWLTGRRRPVVIAISRYVGRQLQQHYHYPESHIRHILNGVDLPPADPARRASNRRRVRKQFGIGDDDVLLLQVCHNFRLKGVGCLIEALSALRRRAACPVKVVVVGRGRTRPWEAMARRMKVGDLHKFAGAADNVNAYYHAADVLVHPSYYDPCSRVVLEALSWGLPVIGSRFDGASEVIEEGVTGFVIETPDAIAALADRIQRVCDSKVRGAMCGALAKRGKMCGLTMTRHVDEVLRLYRQMVGLVGSGDMPGETVRQSAKEL